jgi:hypothetical protein
MKPVRALSVSAISFEASTAPAERSRSSAPGRRDQVVPRPYGSEANQEPRPERGHYLVGDQHDAVAPADGHCGPVVGRRTMTLLTVRTGSR